MGRWSALARGERTGGKPGVRSLRLVLVGTFVLVAGLLVATFANASHVDPVPGPTNPQVGDCPTGSVGWKYEPVASGTVGDGTLSVTVTVNDTSEGETFDFSSNLPIVTVFVKGGPVSNRYVYDPAVTSDSGLHAPVNPNSGKYYGLSHIVFCYSTKGTIVVEKRTDPAGDAQSFSFTSDFAGSFSLSDGQTKDSGSLSPGTYSVSETVPAGWDLTSAKCSDGSLPSAISLQAGETVTCTFTNTKRGSITVVKQTDPENSEVDFPFAFGKESFTLTGGESKTFTNLVPGTYSVAEDEENLPEGWSLGPATCDDGSRPSEIVLSAGETVTCTFVNVQDGEIVVEKQTVPDGYQPPGGPFVFTGAIEAELGDGESASRPVAPGEYTVSEEERRFWDVEIVCDDEDSTGDNDERTATYRVDPGERVTCVFTNTKRSLIVVKKVTDPEDAEQRFEFEPSWGDGFTLADGEEQVSPPLRPGTYSVVELPVEGWELDSAECSNGDDPRKIELPASTVVTCTFRNVERRPEPGTIVVEKRTVPAGDPTEFEFTFGPAGSSSEEDEELVAAAPTVFSLRDGEQEVFDGLDAGTYSVSELVPEGWYLTSAECDNESDPSAIELSEGETVTCVFENTKRGTIVVEKRTSPAGAAGSFTFTGDAAGSIGHGGQIVVPNLVPGTYSTTESEAEGWLLTEIACDDRDSSSDVGSRTATFEVDPGETVTCVFTNARLVTGRGAISVAKSASPTSVKEPGGSVTYTVTIRNVSDVPVSIENVVDDRFGDLDDSGGNGCFDVPINLPPGASTFCQFTGTVSGAAGTTHVNVVTATGKDAFDNPVSGSDDARVEITPRLIDLVIDKTATSPTPLNGTVTYTLTVTNRGPDPATNVQLADPAPAGVQYQSASSSQGTCAVTPALVTCNLGTIAPGQVVTVTVTGRATATGTHVNTATVSGQGGRETNPADNTDSAQTVVPAPLKPPAKPSRPSKPKPPVVEADVCLALTVSPASVTADGKPDRVRTLVTAGKKRMKGVRVVIRGVGVAKTGRTNERGVAVVTINPRRAGIITITAQERNREICGPKRIGAVGVFLPPVTG